MYLELMDPSTSCFSELTPLGLGIFFFRFFKNPPPPPSFSHIPLYYLSTRQYNLAFFTEWLKGELGHRIKGGSVKNLFGGGRNGCTHKIPKQPYPESSPNSWVPSLGQGSGHRRRRTEGRRPEPLPAVLPHLFAPSGCIFPTEKKRPGSLTRPGTGPPVGDGPPAAGGARGARSPAATLIVTRLQLNKSAAIRGCGGASAQRHLGPRSRWSCGGKAEPPPAFFRPAARGGGGAAAARVLPAPAARGSAATAGDQLLQEAEKQREEPGGAGERGGRGPSGSRERH